MSNVVYATEDNFDSSIKEGKVLVDFYADWCGPCQVLSPIIDVLNDEISELKVVKVDVDNNQEIAVKYNILSMPTMLLFVNGELVDQRIGALPKDELKTWIESK